MTDLDGETAHDRATALTAIHAHGDAVRREAVETALSKLDDLDAEQQATVDALATRLVAGLLAPPTAALAAGDDEAVETAMALFGPEDDGRPLETADSEGDATAATAGD